MRGVILGAGEGSRLGGTPKALATFHDGPLVVRQVRYLRSCGIEDVTVTLLGKWANEIFGLAHEHRFHVSFERRAHGTAGSLFRALKDPDECVLVLLGDIVTDLPLSGMVRTLTEAQAAVAVCVDDCEGKGVVRTDSDGRVLAFEEKWPDNQGRKMVCAGVYAFRPSMFPFLRGGFVDLGSDVFPALLDHGMVVGAVGTNRPVIGIDTFENLEAARTLARSEGFAW